MNFNSIAKIHKEIDGELNLLADTCNRKIKCVTDFLLRIKADSFYHYVTVPSEINNGQKIGYPVIIRWTKANHLDVSFDGDEFQNVKGLRRIDRITVASMLDDFLSAYEKRLILDLENIKEMSNKFNEEDEEDHLKCIDCEEELTDDEIETGNEICMNCHQEHWED